MKNVVTPHLFWIDSFRYWKSTLRRHLLFHQNRFAIFSVIEQIKNQCWPFYLDVQCMVEPDVSIDIIERLNWHLTTKSSLFIAKREKKKAFGWRAFLFSSSLNKINFIFWSTLSFLIAQSIRKHCFCKKKMGQPRPLFRLFSVFSNKQCNFYSNSMWKNVMSIKYRYSAGNQTHDPLNMSHLP